MKLETANVLNHIPRGCRVYLDTTSFLVTSVKTSAADVISAIQCKLISTSDCYQTVPLSLSVKSGTSAVLYILVKAKQVLPKLIGKLNR